jgi:uncharacterized membrane protein
MPWQFSALLYILFSSTRSIQNRRIGIYNRDMSAYALIASFVCVFLGGLAYALLSWSSVNHEAARNAWPFLIVGGSLFAAINLLVIKTYRYLPASLAIFMSIMNVISVILFAFLFTDETLSVKQWMGAATLLIAIVLIAIINNRNGSKKYQNHIILGISLTVVTALIFGPAMLNEKYLVDRLGLETYLLYGWGVQAVAAFSLGYLLSRKKKETKKISFKMHVNVWIYGVLLALSGLTYVISLKGSGSASLTIVISVANVALTALLAYIILKERTHLFVKLLGILLTGIGLFLLFT